MKTLAVLGRRALINLFVFIGIICAAYALMRIVPGNPYTSERALSTAAMEALKEKYDFTLFEYLKGIVTSGDFRYSYQHRDMEVRELLVRTLPVSLELGGFALALAVCMGGLWGLGSAISRGKVSEGLWMLPALIGIAIPTFVVGPLLQLLFSLKWNITPVAGWYGWETKILPVIALSLPYSAYIARILRGSLVDTQSKDHIRTAKAKGLSPSAILIHHQLRGSMVPLVNFIGPASASLLTGTLVIEKIFNIPGLGRYFVESALQRDYPVALAVLIVYSGLLLTFNLLTDWIQTLIDPRIQLE